MTEWTITTLKEHLEKIVHDRDVALKAAMLSSQDAIDKAEQRINEILQKFPQEYGRKTDYEALESEINKIKSDHVQRREISDLKEAHAQGRGARLAASAALGIIIALISVALGAMYANQLTNEDVSSQIEREAPWLADKPRIEDEIHQLEQDMIALRTKQAAHEATDRIRAAQNK